MRKGLGLAFGLVLILTGCQNNLSRSTKDQAPIPAPTMALMDARGMERSDPILMRAFKKEAEIEVWKLARDGKYALLKTFPICRWSGQLGPKIREGDRQAPEGFYEITPGQMNPNSALYLSFSLGYPNAYDRAHGRTGSHLMVHGSCSSQGCFAMTDDAISEIYALAREAFAGGQRSIHFQSYPFRMTAENLAQHRHDPHISFWQNLKVGSDHFDVTRLEPRVSVEEGKYAFAIGEAWAAAVRRKRSDDARRVSTLVAEGVRPIKLVYQDGGQHTAFRESRGPSTGSVLKPTPPKPSEVSRPEALTAGPQEIVLASNGAPAGRGESSSHEKVLATRPVNEFPRRGDVGAAPIERPLDTAGIVDRSALTRMLSNFAIK